jgi:acetaldehyde dehydrogenase
MRALVPGYRVTSCTSEGHTVRVVEVTATRSRIPVHAGNLEVISAAAIHAAEHSPGVRRDGAGRIWACQRHQR